MTSPPAPRRENEAFVVFASSRSGKVGCALIQAILGGTVPADLLARLDWQIDGLEEMRPYTATRDELERLPQAVTP